MTAARTAYCLWRQQELSIVFDGSKNCLWRQRDLSMTAARIVYDGSKNYRWFIFIFILLFFIFLRSDFVTSPETTMAARSAYDGSKICLWRRTELSMTTARTSLRAARTVYYGSKNCLLTQPTEANSWGRSYRLSRVTNDRILVIFSVTGNQPLCVIYRLSLIHISEPTRRA